MREKINQEVSVVMYYSAGRKQVIPHMLSWQNKQYLLNKVDYHHTVKDGQVLHHIFELTDKDESIHFRLNFDTSNLHWKLEAVHDGNPN